MSVVKSPGQQIIDSTLLPALFIANVGILYSILMGMSQAGLIFNDQNIAIASVIRLVQIKGPIWSGYVFLIFSLILALPLRKFRVRFGLLVPDEAFQKFPAIDMTIALAFINLVLGLGLLSIT